MFAPLRLCGINSRSNDKSPAKPQRRKEKPGGQLTSRCNVRHRFHFRRIAKARDITHQFSNAVRGERLRNHPVDPGCSLFIGSDRLAPTSDHGDWNLLVQLANLTRQLPTAHSRHADVSKDSIKLKIAKHTQSLAATCSNPHVAIFAFENILQQIPNEVFVINDEHSRLRAFTLDQ